MAGRRRRPERVTMMGIGLVVTLRPPSLRLADADRVFDTCRTEFQPRTTTKAMRRAWHEQAQQNDRGALAQAARTVERNFSTSCLRRLLSFDNNCAADKTRDDATPVSLAPRSTSVMLDETSLVPFDAC